MLSSESSSPKEMLCDYWYYEEEFGFVNIPLLVSVVVGLPTHIFIIFRLLTKKLNLNNYHYFLIGQSCNSILSLINFTVVFVFRHFFGCFIDTMNGYGFTMASDVSLYFEFLASAICCVYWKSIVKTQKTIDRCLFTALIIPNFLLIVRIGTPFIYVYGSIAPYSFTSFYLYSLDRPLNLFYQCPVLITAIIALILVTRMNKSTFSQQTLRCYNKMMSALFTQVAFLTIGLVPSIVCTYATLRYYLIQEYLVEHVDPMYKLNLTEAELDIIREEDKKATLESYAFRDLGNFNKDNFFCVIPLLKAIVTWWCIRNLLQNKKPAQNVAAPSVPSSVAISTPLQANNVRVQ